MKNTDVSVFLNLMTGLGVLYGKSINESLIEIYWRALDRFDFPAVREAVQAHINNSDVGQYMPKPADVVRYLEGSSIDRVLQAWNKVLQATREIGSYRNIVFDDPIIHIVVGQMGGWIKLCRTNEKELSFRIREFEKLYKFYLIHKPSNYPNQLNGYLEHANQYSGLTSEPVLFGNHELALNVYQNKVSNSNSQVVQTIPLSALCSDKPNCSNE